MQVLKESSIAHIEDIPGLYISDISVPSSPAQLQEHRITHILSLMNDLRRPSVPPQLGIVHKRVPIEDDALGDLLDVIDEICEWIEESLACSRPVGQGRKDWGGGAAEMNNPDAVGKASACEPKILVHCLQGISRSGAVVVAYLMRMNSLDYMSALKVARRHRGIITPNEGFAEQLELWHRMGYKVREDDGKEKGIYVEWKESRYKVLNGGEEEGNKIRVRSMASIAARLGEMRLQKQKSDDDTGVKP